jgi:hypothetical protein
MKRCLTTLVFALALLPVAAQEDDNRFEQILIQRQDDDQQFWAQEVLAQQYEQTFVKLWDQQRESDLWLDAPRAFEFNHIEIADPGHWESGIEAISTALLDANSRVVSRRKFLTLLSEFYQQGYRVVQTEWHHATFTAGQADQWHSTFNIVIDLENIITSQRLHITGPIRVSWSDRHADDGRHIPDIISTTGLTIQRRTGKPMMQRIDLTRFAYRTGFDDLIAHDLDGDGLSELIALATNQVLWNKNNGKFNQKKLFRYPIGVVMEAIFADFSGDGKIDCLVAGANIVGRQKPTRFTLFLFESDGSGKFDQPARALLDRSITFTTPSGFAVGDIDQDGDLDLFIPQYKPPYAGGQFPTPYFNANDGYPGYLLLNQGDGRMVDATEKAGLTAKRFRRAYRSSFLDLDEDGDLDLLVVSDFAGLDIYRNDGQGRFEDITTAAVDVPGNFGMSHTFGDYNTDGRLDLYVTGMASTTARRLERMGLQRKDMPIHSQVRTQIAYGNRIYLGSAIKRTGLFSQPEWKDSVARAGWSWGAVTADLNNDAAPDLYVANGNKSGQTAKDYCTRFWCHDIYSGGKERDKALWQVYLNEAKTYITGGGSWNGFEHNRMYMNLNGNNFTDVAFLMNAALEEDCRAVIADDFNADGKPDLAIMSQTLNQYRQSNDLHILINQSETNNHWIGVRLGSAPGVSPMGARVTIGYFNGIQTGVYVAGDSFSAQQAPVKHFGLGGNASVDYLQITWPNGKVQRIDHPAVDQYHQVDPN